MAQHMEDQFEVKRSSATSTLRNYTSNSTVNKLVIIMVRYVSAYLLSSAIKLFPSNICVRLQATVA